MNGNSNPAVRRFQTRWLGFAIFVTVGMFGWLSWHVFNTFQVGRAVKEEFVRSEETRDRICDLHQRHMVSAAMFVATGDPSWENLHDGLESGLSAAIRRALDEHRDGYNREVLERLQTAHEALRAIESRAFELARTGQVEDALARLSHWEYEGWREAFTLSAAHFIRDYREYLNTRLLRERDREVASLVVAFFIFAITMGVWMVLVSRLERRREALVQEIQERTNAEVRLAESLEKYRNLFEQAKDSILIVDPQSHRVIDANQNASVSLGYSRERLVGLSLEDIDPLLAGRGGQETWSEAPGDSRGVGAERQFRRQDGGSLSVEVSARLIGFTGKKVLQLMVRDITQRKQLEEELRQSQKMEAVGQLASGIAHDFNNLLTAISGYVFLAKDSLPETHAAGNALERLEQAAEHANGITRALLTFGREARTQQKPVDMSALVQQTGQLLQGTLPASVQLEIDVDDSRPVWVEGDRTQLQQVLLNLAINARDAMPGGGQILVKLDAVSGNAGDGPGAMGTAPASVARVRVTDTGSGMAPEIQQRAFEPFFTTKSREEGTGLGLSIVHGIVTAHNGRLELVSQPGQGTTVTVFLPLTSPVIEAVHAQGQSVRHQARGVAILLAEDHGFVREVMTATLQSAGHHVIQVQDGPALLEMYRRYRQTLGLLIIDVDLPGRNGLDCLRDIRVDGCEAPAIITTGMVAPGLEDQLQGEALVLRKPFPMDELERLASLLTRTEEHQRPI